MCATCMTGAATAATGVLGVRVWLASRLSARALRRASAVLVALGLLAAATVL